MSFYARQPLRLLSSSKVATAALAALHVRAFSPETTLGRVGTDQAISKARLTIDAAWSDKSHVAKNIENFRLPLHYINPALRR
jgi:hypothetical protein